MALPVEEARDKVLAAVSVLPEERVGIIEALGRVLARDVTSDIDIAPFDNSAMDGFAVRADDLAGASPETPVELVVVDHIAAGGIPVATVGHGEASRIMTGAPTPDGADAVVMIEYTRVVTGDGSTGSTVAFEREPRVGDHIRRAGEDVTAGAVVLRAGEVVGPAAAGLLAATGNVEVPVHRRPRVAIMATGSELVPSSEKPGPGAIRDSNTYSVGAQVVAAGAEPIFIGIVRDTEEATRAAFERAAAEADFIVTTGGVSVGDFDYVRPIMLELGSITFEKVDMRPGNPQTLGEVRGVPLFGLPGNPSSTYVGFEMFVRPAIKKMAGHATVLRPTVTATLTEPVKKRQGRRYFMRARLVRGVDGYEVALPGSQSSALLSTAHRSNCLMVLPEGPGEFPAGSQVQCVRLDVEEATP